MGAVAELLRTKSDWASTALGDPANWPQSLKTAFGIALSSRFPMVLFWGEELSMLYNDAYAVILRDKHPTAFGAPARVAWAEIWDVIRPMLEKALAGEATWSEDQYLTMHRRGFLEEAYFTWSYSPITGESGAPAGVFTAVQEMTERVLSERRLAILRKLGEHPATTIDDACATAIRVLASNPNDVPFAAIYVAEGDAFRRVAGDACDDAWCLREVSDANAARRVERADVDLPGGPWPEPSRGAFVVPIAKPGEHAPYGVLVAGLSPRLSFDEKYESFLRLAAQQVASAISNAVAHEEERERAEALAEIDRAKTTFFGNVSHELRTPLTLMLAPIEDMLAGPLEPEERERAELLRRNALRLLKLVNNLLDFSRIEAGRVEASYEPTDLGALTSELASVFRSMIERAGLSFDVECDELREPAFVDRTMWEKIVFNLISNAFKFTFEGSIRVRVSVEEGFAQLEVADTGIGIAEDQLSRVFERFHRIEGARARSHEGSGIGLALVSELVKMHGGEITVKSARGEGTTFRVRVPLGSEHLREAGVREGARATASARPYIEEADRWGGAPVAFEKPASEASARILVADDNADMRDYVTRLLREHWSVVAVSDGAAALEAARQQRFDLVLADVMMPELDGFGLLRAMRAGESTKDVPIVLLSARAGEEAVTEGLRAGADDYMVKPFTARELLVRVTARLAAAKATRDRAQIYRAFMQVPFPVGVFRGPSHVIEAVNDAILDVWKKDASIVGKPLMDVLPELRDQAFPSLLDRVRRTGEPHRGLGEHARLAQRDGTMRDVYFNYVYAPVFDANGDDASGVRVIAFDVTEHMRTSSRLEAARDELDAMNRAKDEFLATMSHELRTPLNAMLGWASMLRADGADPARVKHGLAAIERNARAQARLVDDLLDIARIVSGKLHLSIERADIAMAIAGAADAVRPAADAKRVRLEIDLDPEIPPTMADAARLQQIVWNLLSNAVRFTPEGGRVAVTSRRSGSNAIIRVTDTGIGIAREHISRVFDRFRQIDSSMTRAHGGLGLGLAIVRYLTEAHGGVVEASSDGVGTGTTFTLTLPLREPMAPVIRRVTTARAKPSLANVRVLVVDDDSDSLFLLRAILESAGADVTTATRAHEALSAAGPFNVVVSDIGMPEMDGYSFIRELRTTNSTVPAIALTAYARNDDVRAALSAGFQQHFAKPVDPDALVAAIETWSSARAS